jgi:uncharacterized protein YcaQ
MTRATKVSPAQARGFLRRAHLVDSRAPDVGSALGHHGYVQIDPINVCGRMHDHILRNRIVGYAEGDLMRHLHGDGTGGWMAPGIRTAFEHHLPSTGILVAFPLDAWPHLHGAMRARTKRASAWSGRLTAREKEFAGRMMERFAGGGALGPEAFADDRKGRRVWGSATLAKATLQKLFFHGRLLIVGRQNNHRLYDLPERVLPGSVLAAPERSASETARWLAVARLRQHRLVALKRRELALVEDLVQEIRIEGCPSLHCLRSDLHWLEAPGGTVAPPADPLLLAPLDPMIYDRRLTRLLWGFDYAWEAYVPARRRKRGHYALPVLSGTELVGHIDAKVDRDRGRLDIVSRRVRRGHRTLAATRDLARFLGVRCG